MFWPDVMKQPLDQPDWVEPEGYHPLPGDPNDMQVIDFQQQELSPEEAEAIFNRKHQERADDNAPKNNDETDEDI